MPKTQFFNVTFFTSPVLDPGEHTLVITNLNGTEPNRLWLDWFWFDAVDVTSNPSASASAVSASASAVSAPGSSTTSSGVFTSSPTVSTATSGSPSNDTSSGSGHSQNLGAIVGGSVGGAVALILLGVLCAYCFFKRRSARSQRGAREVSLIESDSASSPFMRHEPRFVQQPSTYDQTTTTPAASYLTNGDSASTMVPPGPSATVATSRPSLDIRTSTQRESTLAPSPSSVAYQPTTPNMSEALPSSAALKSTYSPNREASAVNRLVQNEMPLSPGESEPPPYAS
ncbi:hypothetical protein BC628DRAFT_1415153 [Trametes gibbosa]|nr:hypothetical protein BC628DRAFT_1415153 [Trametes gibbosa]